MGAKRSKYSRCLNRHNGHDAHDDGAIWGYRHMQKCTASGCGLRGPSPASGDAKSAGTPDRDAPNAKIKCLITRACRACFGSNAGGRRRLRLSSARLDVSPASLVHALLIMPHHRHAPTYQPTIATSRALPAYCVPTAVIVPTFGPLSRTVLLPALSKTALEL